MLQLTNQNQSFITFKNDQYLTRLGYNIIPQTCVQNILK